MMLSVEWVRQSFRRIVGANSFVYRMGAVSLDFAITAMREGVGTWKTLKLIEKETKGSHNPRQVKLRSLLHPILVRPGTLDSGTIINNVIRAEYGRLKLDNEPDWMIDAGAYIGDTTAYFLSRFPGLKVIALEPNPENFEAASKNLAPYGERAIAIQKALHCEEGELCFSGSGTAGAISGMGQKVESTSIPALINKFSIKRINILKIDIEGGEEALFKDQPEVWLSRVDWLILEIHSDSILALISRVLLANGFSMRPYRSIWYCHSSR
jgi:FkbM family methyltransferase